MHQHTAILLLLLTCTAQGATTAPTKPPFDPVAFNKFDQFKRLALAKQILAWRDAQLANFTIELARDYRRVDPKTGVENSHFTRPPVLIKRLGDQFLYSSESDTGTANQPPRQHTARWDGVTYRGFTEKGTIDPARGTIRSEPHDAVIGVRFNNLLGFRAWGVEKYVAGHQVQVGVTLPQWLDIFADYTRPPEVETELHDGRLALCVRGFHGYETYTYWLDIERDFIPVRANYVYRRNDYRHGTDQRVDRAERRDGLWVPVQATVFIRDRDRPDEYRETYTAQRFTRNDVMPPQLRVPFVPGAKVMDGVGALAYVVGKAGQIEKPEGVFHPAAGRVIEPTQQDVADALAANPVADDLDLPARRERVAKLLERNQRRLHESDPVWQKPAPQFPQDLVWLNSPPLVLAELRGRPVILDFFAEWCGPCQNEYPVVASVATRKNVMVIGVHAQGSDRAKIDALVKRFKMNYPICIDVGTGLGGIFSAYGVGGIPHAVLIDSTGIVVGRGNFRDVYAQALGR